MASSADDTSNSPMGLPPNHPGRSEMLRPETTRVHLIIATNTTHTTPNSEQYGDLGQTEFAATPFSDNSWQSTPHSRLTKDSGSLGLPSASRGSSPDPATEPDNKSERTTSCSSYGSLLSREDDQQLPGIFVLGATGPEYGEIGQSDDELTGEGLDLTQSRPSRQALASDVNQAARATFSREDSPLPNLVYRPVFPPLSEQQSEITDFGAVLHYKHRQSRQRRDSRSKPSGHHTLQDRLWEALAPNEDKSKKGFFPANLLPLLLTEQSVSEELNKHFGDKSTKYARKICSEKRVNSFEEDGMSSMKQRIRTYRRVFAILMLIDKTPAIRQFIREGVNDSDLPLVRSGTGKGMRRSRALDKELKCFRSGWTGIQIRNFVDYQWTTLAPFFSKGEKRKEVHHYPLQDRVILPFSPNKKQDEVNQELLGGGGRVFKTSIHPDHHNFHAFFDCPRAASPSDHGHESPECTCVFAIKCLHSQNKESFKKEVDMLKKFSNNAHANLISLLATYEQNGTFFLIFPCADDDLQTYWKKMPPPPAGDADGVRWAAEQCLGIAKGVLKIHEGDSGNSRLQPHDLTRIVGNHGDIKPENVLWFRDKTEARGGGRPGGGGRGTLKLSDFGLADSSSRRTASRRCHSNVAVTCNYRAPECDLPHQGGKGRQYDMWTLGCLYLEFVTWLVGGTALLDEFMRKRLSVDMAWYEIETDTFFQLDKDPETEKLYALVKPSVTERLRSDKRCTPFILDFLDLIETGLLVVKNPEPFVKGRLSINEAHARLTKMVQKCNAEREYTCKSLYYMSASQGGE
ncbi:hypothetical protein B0T24DRAFT_577909 [Lasiosphaeria ovina]|uniref:Protein kinase domain-containing protein n=1 Tax=Lasiosphaeria ovina TaxID=92902 RepID=A0AAE0N4X9_9PEZI|nr:hypothetical protein B0T24DRAFT_577909 [Lasiosphaeria ovina]